VDRLPAAGSWLPGKTGIWTGHRLQVRGYRTTPVGQMFCDYRKTPVVGQITGCGFAVTGNHRYLDRSMDSPRRYFLPILGFRRAGQREKKTQIAGKTELFHAFKNKVYSICKNIHTFLSPPYGF
jgi:hypothetical protein